MSGRNRDTFWRMNMPSFQARAHFSENPVCFYPPDSEAPFHFYERPPNRWPPESPRIVVFDEGVRRWPPETPRAPYQPSNSFRAPRAPYQPINAFGAPRDPSWPSNSFEAPRAPYRPNLKSPHHWSASHHWSAKSPTKAPPRPTKEPVPQGSSARSILETYLSNGNTQESTQRRPPPPEYSRDLREKLNSLSHRESFRTAKPMMEEQVHRGSFQSSMPSRLFFREEESQEESEFWRDDWQGQSSTAAEEQASHLWSSNPVRGPALFNRSHANDGTFPLFVPPGCPEDSLLSHEPQGAKKAKGPRIRKKKMAKLLAQGLLKPKKSGPPPRRFKRPVSLGLLGRRKKRLAKSLRKATKQADDDEESEKRRKQARKRIPKITSKLQFTTALKTERKRINKRRREYAAMIAASNEAAAKRLAAREANNSIQPRILTEIKSENE